MKRIFRLFSLAIVFSFLVTLMGMSTAPAYATSSGPIFTTISPPLPGGWTSGYLYGVGGSSASNVYAVGEGFNATGDDLPLIDQNAGNGWTTYSPPLPSGWVYGLLNSVWSSNASHVYAVGMGSTTARTTSSYLSKLKSLKAIKGWSCNSLTIV